MLTRRMMLLAPVSLLGACGGIGARSTAGLAPDSQLIVYRHADRSGELLSGQGHRRAAAFATALDGVPVDAIHALKLERNLQTAAPLAAARGLRVQTLTPVRLAEKLARSARGRSVVWIGNMNNLRAIWAGLALPDAPPLDYGALVILSTDAAGELHSTRHMVAPLAD